MLYCGYEVHVLSKGFRQVDRPHHWHPAAVGSQGDSQSQAYANQPPVLYKEQMSVAQGFRFIKEPRHIGPVFLKRPDRIDAFAYAQTIALLVYTLIQKKP